MGLDAPVGMGKVMKRRSTGRWTRRDLLKGGAVGIGTVGLSAASHLHANPVEIDPRAQAKACIYIFLSGGLAQHESFDPKPDAPEEIRGEFKPIATRTPGLALCEHLPLLASRTDKYSVVRSLSHHSNDHSAGHHIMLTGRSDLPRGFDPNRPMPTDHPSIVSIVGAMLGRRPDLPAAAVLPEKLIHSTGRVIPGQFAGQMGPLRQPWFIEASPFHSTSYGAFPTYKFDHQDRGHADHRIFQAPSLSLPEEFAGDRLEDRLAFLAEVEKATPWLDQSSTVASYGQYRQGAMGLLTDPKIRHALDVTRADARQQERYGKHSFGWSLLMARQLVEAGVSMVQVNLGNDETWDTHGEAFPHLKEKLLPPMDQSVAGLLDDLSESGLLDSTLVVMAGEFGRTPKISHLRQHYKLPGRDHWGAVQSLLLAGGGVAGGRVIGASDKHGGFPIDSPQSPENLAATIYDALGIPRSAAWFDTTNRPNLVYHAEPIAGLS